MKSISINNSKIANMIKKYDDLTGARNVISVSTRGAKVNKDVQFVITDNLTVLDMAIADAIYSIKLQGDTKFTARKILTTLSGDEEISVCRDRKAQIDARIEKLINCEIYIDCSIEAGENILPGYQGKFINAVKEGNGYRLQEDNPYPLYSYAEAKRHIITVPWELLSYKPAEGREKEDKLINSNENMLLKYYIVQQLEIVRNKNNKVDEKTIYIKNSEEFLRTLEIPAAELTEETVNNKIREIYKKSILLFDHWKRTGYIKDYTTDIREYSFYVNQDMLPDNIYKLFK